MIHSKDSLGNMDTPARGYLVFILASLHLWGNVKVAVATDACPFSFDTLLLGGVNADFDVPFIKLPDVFHILPLYFLLPSCSVSPLL